MKEYNITVSETYVSSFEKERYLTDDFEQFFTKRRETSPDELNYYSKNKMNLNNFEYYGGNISHFIWHLPVEKSLVHNMALGVYAYCLSDLIHDIARDIENLDNSITGVTYFANASLKRTIESRTMDEIVTCLKTHRTYDVFMPFKDFYSYMYKRSCDQIDTHAISSFKSANETDRINKAFERILCSKDILKNPWKPQVALEEISVLCNDHNEEFLKCIYSDRNTHMPKVAEARAFDNMRYMPIQVIKRLNLIFFIHSMHYDIENKRVVIRLKHNNLGLISKYVYNTLLINKFRNYVTSVFTEKTEDGKTIIPKQYASKLMKKELNKVLINIKGRQYVSPNYILGGNLGEIGLDVHEMLSEYKIK